MPIINIQRRMAELGRIRLGVKVATGKSGKTRPSKLDRFRFTSPNQALIDQIADRYGGTPEPWDNNGKPEHQVITDATSIPVIVVKGGLSQWMETWTGGGCVHRCDGERNVLTDTPCDPNDPNHVNAKPTTRLSVMLSEIESLGVWRMETHGWNAAAEIPAMAELAMYVGDLVPATLFLQERRAVVDGTTTRFVVPVLDLQVTKARLVELVGRDTGATAITGPTVDGPAAIAAPTTNTTDYAGLVADATTVEECRGIWRQAADAGQLSDELKATITARVAELSPPDDQAAPDADGVVDAEVEDDDVDPDADAAWQALVAVAGKAGIKTSELAREVEAVTGRSVADATADDFRAVMERIEGAVA